MYVSLKNPLLALKYYATTILLKATSLKAPPLHVSTPIVIFKNNKVLKITITTRGGESKQTHSHRRDATQNRIIFDDGYNAFPETLGYHGSGRHVCLEFSISYDTSDLGPRNTFDWVKNRPEAYRLFILKSSTQLFFLGASGYAATQTAAHE
jgi:hypothetical protein